MGHCDGSSTSMDVPGMCHFFQVFWDLIVRTQERGVEAIGMETPLTPAYCSLSLPSHAGERG